MSEKSQTLSVNNQEEVSILIVDDNSIDRLMISTICAGLNVTADMASTGEEALMKFKEKRHRLVITDYVMEPMCGLKLASHLREIDPDVEIILVSGAPSAEVIAYVQSNDLAPVITKPISPRALINTALLSLDRKRGRCEVLGKVALSNRMDTCLPLIGSSAFCRKIRAEVVQLLQTEAPVYISGPSGCGKVEVADLLHQEGARGHSICLEYFCSKDSSEELSQSLITEDGVLGKIIHMAAAGTLVLHDIEELPMVLQRAMSENFDALVSKVKLLVLSNISLDDLLDAEQIDQGLYFKLSLEMLELPPLSERIEDLSEMIEYISQYPEKYGLKEGGIDIEAFLQSECCSAGSIQKKPLVSVIQEFSGH